MKTNLKTIALIFTIFTLTAYSQWTLCPGSGSITGLGINPVISVADQLTTAVAGGVPGVPKVFLTTNGGFNFVNISGNLTGPELYSVYAVNNNIIFAGDGGSNGGAVGNAKVWKTTNMGINWINILTTGGTTGFISGIRFANNAGIIVSDGPTGSGVLVYKTTNGGVNWSSQNVNSGGFSTVTPGSIFVNNDQFYGFGANGVNKVTYTTNGGSLWNTLTIPLTGNGLLVDCNLNMNCVAVSNTSLPNIYRFTIGISGSMLNTGIGLTNPTSLRMLNYGIDQTFMSIGSGSNSIYRGTNFGLNWSQMTTSSVSGITSTDCKLSQFYYITAMAVSSGGLVIKFSSIIPGIQLINELIPESYKLEQNYPNPFNPVTNINYSIPKLGFVTLKIYNSLGKLVKTLVNSEQTAGNYTVDFSAEELSSGIYYYTISTGDFTDTKKMVVIK